MKNARVLIVEDEKIVAEDIRDRLTNFGYSVPGTASSGEEAIALAAKILPDVILMDIRLRGTMDGIEASRYIRARFDIPIVFLTAYADDDTLSRAVQTEPFGYILKPVESRELRTGIEVALYKHAIEKALKEREEWLSTTLRSIGEAVVAADAQNRIRLVNPVAERLTGWTQQELSGMQFTEILERIARPRSDLAIEQESLLTGVPERTRFTARDGRVFPIDETIAPIRDAKGNVIGTVLVFTDATDRQRAEMALRDVSKNILDTQEAERHRVARELHDGVIQLLSAARYRFNSLEERLVPAKKDFRRDATKIRVLLDRTVDELRRISRNLRPSELDDLGLLAAVRIACEEFRERTGIKLEAHLDPMPEDLPADISLAIYRIVQEALTNIEKHSDASKATIGITSADATLSLTIADNGRGFDTSDRRLGRGKKMGSGIVNMIERSELIGATFQMASKPQEGATINVRIPISPSRRKQTKKA